MNTLINDFSPGLFIMQTVILLILIVLLRKFAWKPVMDSLQAREEGISNALEAAELAKQQLNELTSKNENLIAEAKVERDVIVKQAKELADKMKADATADAKVEYAKIVDLARKTIQEEKAAAIAELKTQVAAISIEIAEKIVRGELASDEKQKALAAQLAGDINLN
jgi:F-type H+-transporting ATPase subunit b